MSTGACWHGPVALTMQKPALLVIDMQPGGGVVDEAGLVQRSRSRYFARIASTREVLAGIEGAAGDGGTR